MVIGGGQDASHVTTTDRRAGKFEAKFFHKVNQLLYSYARYFFTLFRWVWYKPGWLLSIPCIQILQEEIGGVKGHFGPINALAFNPDGRRFDLLSFTSCFIF